MSSQVYPEYPPDLSEVQQQYLLTNLKDWSIANGLAVRPAPAYVSSEQDPAGALATTAPVTLFPSLFPGVCFEQAKAVAGAYSELYSAIASNQGWLKEIIEEYVLVSLLRSHLRTSISLSFTPRSHSPTSWASHVTFSDMADH
jgi:glutathione synthase